MDAMRECCCGLDVHQAQVTACLLKGPLSQKAKKQSREFSTVTVGLLALRDWLLENDCKEVAMESTGVYWKPIYNILCDTCEVTLGNAADIKNKPGRKTDKKDAEWIAELHRCGMISKSFIAPPDIQELRDLTRYRSKLIGQSTGERNRILKQLESVNIKISTYMSDVFGVSGRQMLVALMDGEVIEPKAVAELAKGVLRKKIPELVDALNGQVTKHKREMIRYSYEHLLYLEKQIEQLEEQITNHLLPYQKEAMLLDTIPGVGPKIAAMIIAEIGVDMSIFPSPAHISSWSGVSPGNNESAGKKKSSKIQKGHKWIRAALLEAAWSAQKTRTFLGAKFWKLAGRGGKKKAAVAIAHKILIIAYYILLTGEPYRELGKDYLEQRRPVSREQLAVNYLKKLGYTVTESSTSLTQE
jgi:transposase